MIQTPRTSALNGYPNGDRVSGFQSFARLADKRLRLLDATDSWTALRMLPSNGLRALRGDRLEQYSIRINQQWRICFHIARRRFPDA
jgi:proteic killer suppression protein